VTRYIEQQGSVNPAIDIYQRWPGFFAWTAELGELTGFLDPVRYAGLLEPAFALLDALLVFAIARSISRDHRWCWSAATLFALSNWVAQNYFAPQAFAYTLQLFVCLLLFTALQSPPRAAALWLERLVRRVLR
ncbi:hypothetical protein, partial [Bradyrhizobium cajani]|uniref:hypothetical protein n=1 Tax=Bradyrhizobium cajani TaxID=1928661 RepID=UPI00197ACE21